MEVETTPRERKIRRGIVVLSSFQVTLGAVIIGMSFTAFASTSSAKIRAASPYWAGFMVLFTGSVGFLTWKQLSIVSIGIYTFLSTASVIVSLVATVLSGDSAGFLKALVYCTEVKFEHACQCCAKNSTCTPSYKFSSVRDCGTVTGLLKDIMYGLCVANVACCIMCLIVTIVGCTLGAQYSRYSQSCAFRWSHPPPQQDYDHRYNWSPYPADPISNLPPWAPPIYFNVPSTPGGPDYQCRRPPTVFDPIDFPPPYTSREPSLAGRQGSRPSLGLEYALGHNGISWDRLGHSVFRFFDQAGTVSEDSIDYIDRTHVGDLGSSSGTSEGVVTNDDGSISVVRHHIEVRCVELISQSQGAISHVQEMLPSSSTESESNSDNVFASSETCTIQHGTSSHGIFGTLDVFATLDQSTSSPLTDNKEQVNQRRHSWSQQSRTTPSENVYVARGEIHRACIPPNVNPWARSLSENEAQRNASSSRPLKQRANSTPSCPADRAAKLNDHDEASEGHSSEGLCRHFSESKSARNKANKKRKRPRNNPGHILEQDNLHKDVASQESPIESEYRETTL